MSRKPPRTENCPGQMTIFDFLDDLLDELQEPEPARTIVITFTGLDRYVEAVERGAPKRGQG